MSTIQLVTALAAGIGGYFLGGVLSNLLDGDGIKRMFSGSLGEQAIQLAVGGALLFVAASEMGLV